LNRLLLEWTETKNSRAVKAPVSSVQIDNQLFEAEKSAAVYMSPLGGGIDDLSLAPALHVYWEEMKSSLNARVFKTFQVFVQPLSLILEERLLLQLASSLGIPSQIESLDVLQKSDFEINRLFFLPRHFNLDYITLVYLNSSLLKLN